MTKPLKPAIVVGSVLFVVAAVALMLLGLAKLKHGIDGGFGMGRYLP